MSNAHDIRLTIRASNSFLFNRFYMSDETQRQEPVFTRSLAELVEVLRQRADMLSGASWELPATKAMMHEAATAISIFRAERQRLIDQTIEALEFAQGAILDAIGLEDGLDGAVGARVIHLIRAALAANGRALMPLPDALTEHEYQGVEQALRAADADADALSTLRAAYDTLQRRNEELKKDLEARIGSQCDPITSRTAPVSEPDRPLVQGKVGVSDECASKTMQRYERHIGPMRAAARERGYALAVHGSLRRDVDLIAAPWTSGASDPETLIEALRQACGGFVKRDPDRKDQNNYLHHSPDPKPHGRLGYQIIPGDGHTYFDVSVLPCAESHAHAEEIAAAKRLGYAEALADAIIAQAGEATSQDTSTGVSERKQEDNPCARFLRKRSAELLAEVSENNAALVADGYAPLDFTKPSETAESALSTLQQQYKALEHEIKTMRDGVPGRNPNQQAPAWTD